MFSDLKTSTWSFVWVDKQILYSFVVNLKHGELDLVCGVLVLVSLNTIENFVTRYRHNSFVGAITNHRIRLSCSRLPVSKQTAMVPVPCVVKNLLSKGLVHVILISVLGIFLDCETILVHFKSIMRPKGIIKGERSISSNIIHNHSLWPIHLDATR